MLHNHMKLQLNHQLLHQPLALNIKRGLQDQPEPPELMENPAMMVHPERMAAQEKMAHRARRRRPAHRNVLQALLVLLVLLDPKDRMEDLDNPETGAVMENRVMVLLDLPDPPVNQAVPVNLVHLVRLEKFMTAPARLVQLDLPVRPVNGVMTVRKDQPAIRVKPVPQVPPEIRDQMVNRATPEDQARKGTTPNTETREIVVIAHHLALLLVIECDRCVEAVACGNMGWLCIVGRLSFDYCLT